MKKSIFSPLFEKKKKGLHIIYIWNGEGGFIERLCLNSKQTQDYKYIYIHIKSKIGEEIFPSRREQSFKNIRIFFVMINLKKELVPKEEN